MVARQQQQGHQRISSLWTGTVVMPSFIFQVGKGVTTGPNHRHCCKIQESTCFQEMCSRHLGDIYVHPTRSVRQTGAAGVPANPPTSNSPKILKTAVQNSFVYTTDFLIRITNIKRRYGRINIPQSSKPHQTVHDYILDYCSLLQRPCSWTGPLCIRSPCSDLTSR